MIRTTTFQTRLRGSCAALPFMLTPSLALAQAEEEDFYLGEIVISATGFEQQIADAPATITVISSEEIEGRSYSGITDILDTVPGISIESSGGGKLPGSSSINMRGFGENYILFLVDGKPIGDSQDAYYNGWGSGQRTQLLPPSAIIERIEIIRGPMSSLYGSAASGGVINIITKPTADVWTGSISMGQTLHEDGGSSDSLQTNYYLTGPIMPGRLGLSFYGSTYDREPDRGLDGFSGVERRTNGVRLNWTLTDNQNLELDYSKSRQNTTRNQKDAADREIITTRQDTSLSHEVFWDNSFETTSFLKREYVDVEEGSNLSAFEQINFNTKTLMVFGSHMMTAGLDYKLERTFHNADRFPGSINTDLERWHASVFVEDEISLTDDFTLTLGGRYDENEAFGDNFTPRVYGVWHMTDTMTLKGGISGGYTVPALKRTDDGIVEQAGRGRGWDKGNSDLKPEESTNYEVGMVWNPRSDLQFGMTAYHTRFTDKIDKERYCDTPDPEGDGVEESEWACTYNGETRQWINQYINLDEAEIQGVEATLDYRIGDFDIRANYTYSHSEITSGDNKGERLNSLPKHMVNVATDWQATDSLSLWGKAKFKSETNQEASEDRTPGYTLVDVGASYDFNDRLRGNISIENAFNKEITSEDYGSLLPGRRYFVGLTARF